MLFFNAHEFWGALLLKANWDSIRELLTLNIQIIVIRYGETHG